MAETPSRNDGIHAALAVATSLAVGLVLTAFVSDSPLQAYIALLTGALPEMRWSETQGFEWRRLVRFGSVLEDTITLTLLGLAVAIPLRARQFSLGADGQMFLGALASVAVSLYVPAPAYLVLPLAIATALLTGFAWGLLPGVLKVRFSANEIVTTLMFNVIAVQLYRLLISGPMRDPQAGYLVTPPLPVGSALQSLLPPTHVSIFLLLVPAAAIAGWALLMRTTLGFEIRTVGQAEPFARRMGMRVSRAVVMSMGLGGVFAALAGVHVGHALLKRLPVDMMPGMGLEGLVVALLARNEPRAIPWAAFFYAYLRTGAQAMERSSDVSREMVLVIQAFIILFVISQRLPWTRVADTVAARLLRGKR